MDQLSITDLGGPYVDAVPVADTESEMAADEGNKLLETVAQGSYTSSQTKGNFTCTTDAAPATVDAANVTHKSHWGNGAATKPTVSKTATGRYTITFPSSWTNGLSASETVSLFTGKVWARTGDSGDGLDAKVLTFSSNVVTIAVYSPAGTLADQGNTSSNDIIIDWDFT